jgi:GMP synthase (glutamine-hydrolysing)
MISDPRNGGIAIIDFGSQYTQLIARRVREQGVYAEVFPHDITLERLSSKSPCAYILSGGPDSIYDVDAPKLYPAILNSGMPILGICYGMYLVANSFGGKVQASETREYGPGEIILKGTNPLFAGLPDDLDVWMSHGDHVTSLPPGFDLLAQSNNGIFAAIGDKTRKIYGVQFHPEVNHTPHGIDLIRNFIFDICGCEAKWSPAVFVNDALARIKNQVGDKRVLLGLSGGVDSAVAAALIHKAIGDKLTCVFVNTGMLRHGEPQQVVQVFGDEQGMNLIANDSTELFLDRLKGVTEPEAKRKIIGAAFIDIFREEADRLQDVLFLAQGTIYPDVIESAADHKSAKTIKSHHNVGGLPDGFKEKFTLVEPLRDLFKDEVRKVGTELGLPNSIVWRQPFPGPGLAIRCLGEITWERLETLRAADAIYLEELGNAGLLREGTSQSFVVLLPVKSVGVMGDHRTYEEVAVLRSVTTDDFMTADWSRLPYDLLAKVSSRIVNEVRGINRVAYDITAKPPATIEWE